MVKNKIILIVSLLAIVLVLVISNYVQKDIFELNGSIGINKDIRIIEIKNDDLVSYEQVDSYFNHWNENEKNKLKEYMKKNELIITSGKYEIGENFKFDKVVEILNFKEKK